MEFEAIIDEHKDAVYHFCCHLTRNKVDADDLFQDTWLKAFEKLHKYDDTYAMKNWLYTIAVNTYKDRYRKSSLALKRFIQFSSSKDQDQHIANVQTNTGIPLTHLIEKEKHDSVKEAVKELPDKFRLPIILYYFKEVDQQTIAKILGVPLGTVKSRLNTGKTKLKQRLEGDR